MHVINDGIRITAAARYADRAIPIELSEKCADGDRAIIERRVDGARGVAVEQRSELLRDAAFAVGGEGGGRVIDRRGDRRRVAKRFDRDDSLAAGGQHLVCRKVRGDLAGAAEAVEAGGGEDRAVVEAGAEFVDARVDVAAD